MTMTNNYSILPFYSDIKYQDRYNSYNLGDSFDLVSPSARLLPFQIRRDTSEQAVQSVKVYTEKGVYVTDLLSELSSTGLTVKKFDGYDLIVYPSVVDIDTVLPAGKYYVTVSDGDNIWFSDLFLSVADTSGLLKIEFWDDEDFEVEDKVIHYGKLFRNYAYLPAVPARPDYDFEEEVTTRKGVPFQTSASSTKTYNFYFLAHEPLADILRLVKLHDNVRITYNGLTYRAITFDMDVKWPNRADIAYVKASFISDSVIVHKNARSSDISEITDPGLLVYTLSDTELVREQFLRIKGADLLIEPNYTSNVYALFPLERNTADANENFASGVIGDGAEYTHHRYFGFLDLLGGGDSYFQTGSDYTARGLLGTDGLGSYTVGIWFSFRELPTSDGWIWSAFDTTGTIGTGLKFNATTGTVDFVRGSVTIQGPVVEESLIYSTVCLYYAVGGSMELRVKGESYGTATNNSALEITIANDTEMLLGGMSTDSEYMAVRVRNFWPASILRVDSDIDEYFIFNKILVYLTNKATSEVYVISAYWIIAQESSKYECTIPWDVPYGDYSLKLVRYDGAESLSFDVSVNEVTLADDFTEDFSDEEAFKARFEALNRQWGGDNGGVSGENVFLGYDTEGNKVLICEAHGDNYAGSVQGVTNDGSPAVDTNGDPITKRVGGCVVSKDYYGYGSYEFIAKPIDVTGVASAFWMFHYQEVYPGDPRLETLADISGSGKYLKDVIDTGTVQDNLRFQFALPAGNNGSSDSGSDSVTLSENYSDDVSFTLGPQNMPTTVGRGYRYNGTADDHAWSVNTTRRPSMLENFYIGLNIRVDELEDGFGESSAQISMYKYYVDYDNWFNIGLITSGDRFGGFRILRSLAGSISGILINPAQTNEDALKLFPNNEPKEKGEWIFYGFFFDVFNDKVVIAIDDNIVEVDVDIQSVLADVPTGGTTTIVDFDVPYGTPLSSGSVKDITICDLRMITGIHIDLNEIRVMRGLPCHIGAIDFTRLGLGRTGSRDEGYYTIRNNEIDIEIPSHLHGGDAENPSLQNAKFNTWLGTERSHDLEEVTYQYSDQEYPQALEYIQLAKKMSGLSAFFTFASGSLASKQGGYGSAITLSDSGNTSFSQLSYPQATLTGGSGDIVAQDTTVGEWMRYTGTYNGPIGSISNLPDLDDDRGFHIHFMFKASSTMQGSAYYGKRFSLIKTGDTSGSIGLDLINDSGLLKLQFHVGNAGSTAVYISADTVLTVDWFYDPDASDSIRGRLYINGVLVTSAGLPSTSITENTWELGSLTSYATVNTPTGFSNVSPFTTSDIRDFFISDFRIFANDPVSYQDILFMWATPNQLTSLSEGVTLSLGAFVRAPELTLEWNFNMYLWEFWETYRDNYLASGADPTDGNYHTYRWDWYPDRVEFYVDDVLVKENKNYFDGVNSRTIPDVGSKITAGAWFPSGSVLWAGTTADFASKRMYIKQIKYTKFDDYEAIALGETYPNVGLKEIE